MNTKTREAALRAAARLTVGTGISLHLLSGCGGNYAIESQTADSAPVSAAPAGDAGSTPGNPAAATSNGDEAPAGATSNGGERKDAAPSTEGPSDVAQVDVATTLACLGPVVLGERGDPTTTAITGAERDCCLAYNLARIGTAGSMQATKDDDPSFANCCKALIARLDVHGEEYDIAIGTPVRSACCSAQETQEQIALWSHSYCTPWGPPMPPAMDDVTNEIV